MSTGECEITLNCFAPVFLGENVVDLKRKWKGKLRQPTVFAAPPSCPLTLRASSRFIAEWNQIPSFSLLMSRRPFDCITPSKVPEGEGSSPALRPLAFCE